MPGQPGIRRASNGWSKAMERINIAQPVRPRNAERGESMDRTGAANITKRAGDLDGRAGAEARSPVVAGPPLEYRMEGEYPSA
jgi:hypothetical protein